MGSSPQIIRGAQSSLGRKANTLSETNCPLQRQTPLLKMKTSRALVGLFSLAPSPSNKAVTSRDVIKRT
ncbi:hypothetical protein TNCT_552541 [Trichonephila clavata]|uniref:Uncharacterized protein n=1 Tax=Trichonephila clavata TaxID=2740835 RepID=A0A8X6H270_TRICU|nr:hypothetical protein TNCT_552541 [Trichonephila clavata]